MAQAFHQGIGDSFRVTREQPRNKRGPIGKGHEAGIQWCVLRTLRGHLALEPERRTGGGLPLGQAIDGIIEQEVIDIHIPPRDVRQMSSADAQSITVASHGEDSQFGPGKLDAGGNRECPAMYRVKPIGTGKKRVAAGAPDAGHHDDLVVREFQTLNGRIQAMVNPEIAAPRAPGGEILGSDGKNPGIRNVLNLICCFFS